MVENKAGGRNTPKKGEQGFQPSKLGKKAPTPSVIKGSKSKDKVTLTPENFGLRIPEYTNPDLATSPEVTKTDLFELARYGNAAVRQRVAEIEDISSETFDLLAKDNNYDVLMSLAWNKNLPKEHFKPLLEKVNNAYGLYFTPPRKTYYGLGGRVESVFNQPLGNYVLDEYQKLYFKGNLMSARHRYLDTDILEQLAKDPLPMVRQWVAENPKTPMSTLTLILGVDKKRKVRKIAKANFDRRYETNSEARQEWLAEGKKN